MSTISRTGLGATRLLERTKNPFGLKPFYALHAWIWKKNPSGLLQPWNPSVACP